MRLLLRFAHAVAEGILAIGIETINQPRVMRGDTQSEHLRNRLRKRLPFGKQLPNELGSGTGMIYFSSLSLGINVVVCIRVFQTKR